MKSRGFYWVAAFAMVLGLAGSAGAAEEEQGPRLAAIMDRLEQLKKSALELVSDQQKEKVEKLFVEAKEQLEQVAKNVRDATGEERIKALRQIAPRLGELRNKLFDLLSPEQREKMMEKYPWLRRVATVFDRVRDEVAKLSPTAEQKEKLEAVFTDMEQKIRKVREKAAGDAQAMAQDMRELMQELKGKLQEILTPEQQEKLRDAVQNGRQQDK